jgi:hypothetical protein
MVQTMKIDSYHTSSFKVRYRASVLEDGKVVATADGFWNRERAVAWLAQVARPAE